jgi:hypothetical protein
MASERLSRLPVIVLVVVVVDVDCLPRQQSEGDDEHEHDQETPASHRPGSSIVYPTSGARATTSTTTIRTIRKLPRRSS